MEVLVNSDGTRNRDFRPYIDQEELVRSVNLYDPDRPFHHGLYETAQPACRTFSQHFRSRMAIPGGGAGRFRGPGRRVWPQVARPAYRGNAYALLARGAHPLDPRA